MGDLIDRQALMEAIGVAEECEQCQYNDTIRKGLCTMPSQFVDVCEKIADAPTVEPVADKHGKWKKISLTKTSTLLPIRNVYECSECHAVESLISKYCRVCGSRMEV